MAINQNNDAPVQSDGIPLVTDASDTTQDETYTDHDTPHLIMTYTALLSLAIFRDDFSQLDRKGLLAFIRTCQRDDGRQVLSIPSPPSSIISSALVSVATDGERMGVYRWKHAQR
ncbi:hypothetical protein C0992_012665 [Termitomyces sp. T32_za158]|nr:hypothetical protein C0992_012665 [Termitomyces sp. T32_za158]